MFQIKALKAGIKRCRERKHFMCEEGLLSAIPYWAEREAKFTEALEIVQNIKGKWWHKRNSLGSKLLLRARLHHLRDA